MIFFMVLQESKKWFIDDGRHSDGWMEYVYIVLLVHDKVAFFEDGGVSPVLCVLAWLDPTQKIGHRVAISFCCRSTYIVPFQLSQNIQDVPLVED